MNKAQPKINREKQVEDALEVVDSCRNKLKDYVPVRGQKDFGELDDLVESCSQLEEALGGRVFEDLRRRKPFEHFLKCATSMRELAALPEREYLGEDSAYDPEGELHVAHYYADRRTPTAEACENLDRALERMHRLLLKSIGRASVVPVPDLVLNTQSGVVTVKGVQLDKPIQGRERTLVEAVIKEQRGVVKTRELDGSDWHKVKAKLPGVVREMIDGQRGEGGGYRLKAGITSTLA